MKKENKIEIPYKKKKMIGAALKLLKSPKKVMILDYDGKELNSIFGFKEDLKHMKLPFKLIFIYLIKLYIQLPLFNIMRHSEGLLKIKIYKHFGMNIGKNVFIGGGVYIDDTFPELISIGEGSIVGKDVTIFSHEATIKHMRFGKVKIGKQVLIGANSIIRSGVTIGDGAVIAMDSLVIKDVPAMEEWGGVPARKIKKLRKLI